VYIQAKEPEKMQKLDDGLATIPRFPGIKAFADIDITTEALLTAAEFRSLMRVIRPIIADLKLREKKILVAFNEYLLWYGLVRRPDITSKTMTEIDRRAQNFFDAFQCLKNFNPSGLQLPKLHDMVHVTYGENLSLRKFFC